MSKMRALHVVLMAVVALTALVVGAATKGDQTPKARHGQTCVSVNDGGTHIATKVIQFADGGSAQITGANAFNVKNPSGASFTVFCGWDDTVNEHNGYPLEVGSSTGIDLTCPGGGRNPTDPCPTFYCVDALNTNIQLDDGGVSCLRWLQVE